MPMCHLALMPMWAYVDAIGMDPIHELQAEICRTLSHPARIAILHLLADEPREVGRLADALDISQPNVSKHLAVMRQAGLVEAERDGRGAVYRLTDPKVIGAALEKQCIDLFRGDVFGPREADRFQGPC